MEPFRGVQTLLIINRSQKPAGRGLLVDFGLSLCLFLFLPFLLLKRCVTVLTPFGFFREPFLQKILLGCDGEYEFFAAVYTNEYFVLKRFEFHLYPPVSETKDS